MRILRIARPRNLKSSCDCEIGLAQLLDRAAPFFRRDSLLARGGLRLRGPPFLGAACRVLEKRGEPGSRRLAILRLRAMLPAVDEQDIVCNHAAAGEAPQTLLHLVGQRRAAHVETQLDRRRHFVDVLPAGPRGPHESLFDVLLVHELAAMLTSRLPQPYVVSGVSGPSEAL